MEWAGPRKEAMVLNTFQILSRSSKIINLCNALTKIPILQ